MSRKALLESAIVADSARQADKITKEERKQLQETYDALVTDAKKAVLEDVPRFCLLTPLKVVRKLAKESLLNLIKPAARSR